MLLFQRLAARWIDTSWRAIRPFDLGGECAQALLGTNHHGRLLIIEGTAIGMTAHTEMRARAVLVLTADVALANIAREHQDLFGLAEESCLTPAHVAPRQRNRMTWTLLECWRRIAPRSAAF